MQILLQDVTIDARRHAHSLLLSAHWDGYTAGKADCVFHADGRILLGELKVCNKVVIRWSLLNPLRIRKINFRRHHIGTLLLKRVLQEAKNAKASEIYGSITRHDLAEWPGLLGWYQRFGFVGSSPDDDFVPDAAWKITLRMN